MIKKLCIVIVLLLLILFLLPIIVVNFSSADKGLGLIIILFFIINPLVAIACGIYSGFNIKKLWFMPIVFSVIFFLSSLLILDIGKYIVVYLCGYSLIGLIAMFATVAIRRILKNK